VGSSSYAEVSLYVDAKLRIKSVLSVDVDTKLKAKIFP
jgi:hypothetical protein